jgi:Natural resistance-associated macrophage protein
MGERSCFFANYFAKNYLNSGSVEKQTRSEIAGPARTAACRRVLQLTVTPSTAGRSDPPSAASTFLLLQRHEVADQEFTMTLIDNPVGKLPALKHRGAILDDAHIGHIDGGMGTVLHGDIAPRLGWDARSKTLLAILGPGLIVMVGDNDAGAFGTYTQAGQNYGATLKWSLMLGMPVLCVNQEMEVRLGAVTGVGHARLILERFGRLWGAFSVIDFFLLNSSHVHRGVGMAARQVRPAAKERALGEVVEMANAAGSRVGAGPTHFAQSHRPQTAAERRPAICAQWDCWGPPLQAGAAAAHLACFASRAWFCEGLLASMINP